MFNIRYHKSKGQNFLLDTNILKILADHIDKSYKYIIEVGVGYGFITDLLVKYNFHKIMLFEIDIRLKKYITNKYSNNNVQIIMSDFLQYNIDIKSKFCIISNLPFHIIKKFFQKVIYYKLCDYMILLIQSEFIDIIKKRKNAFGALVRSFFDYEIITKIHKSMFKPSPKVDGILLKFKRINNTDWLSSSEYELYYNFLKILYLYNRRKIKHLDFINITKNNENLDVRAADLSLLQIKVLYLKYKIFISLNFIYIKMILHI